MATEDALISPRELTRLIAEAQQALDLARSMVDYPVNTLGEALDILNAKTPPSPKARGSQ